MGISSDGQICYGIEFEDEYEFPWEDEEWNQDIEKWWCFGICGYKPLFKIYDENGEHIDKNISPKKINEYYEQYNNFKKINPMNVDIIQHCTYENSIYIIAVPNTYQYNSRGYAKEIKLREISEKEENHVINFCEKYCKTISSFDVFPKMELKWLLTSMMG